jgi:hypothetical protein
MPSGTMMGGDRPHPPQHFQLVLEEQVNGEGDSQVASLQEHVPESLPDPSLPEDAIVVDAMARDNV